MIVAKEKISPIHQCVYEFRTSRILTDDELAYMNAQLNLTMHTFAKDDPRWTLITLKYDIR